MEKFVLSTDSCCDDLKSVLKKNNIAYIAMAYIFEEEVFEDHFDSLQDYDDFYEEMKKGKHFTTTALNPFQLKSYFEEILKEKNKDIIHVALSSGLSGTCQVAKNVAEELNKSYKNKVYIVDSLSATQVQNFILNYAIKLRDKGETAQQAFNNIQNFIPKIKTYFFLNNLETLKKGGRISGAQAVMAKIVQLKPILKFSPKGELEVVEKVLGTKKAIRTLLDYYLKFFDEKSDMPIYLTYAGSAEGAVELKRMLEDKINTSNIVIKPVGPVIGSHTGPSLTGIIFAGK